MVHHALIGVKPDKRAPHTLAFEQPVPGSVLCQLEVLRTEEACRLLLLTWRARLQACAGDGCGLAAVEGSSAALCMQDAT